MYVRAMLVLVSKEAKLNLDLETSRKFSAQKNYHKNEINPTQFYSNCSLRN